MIWSVPRTWDGDTCVVLAGGPSLLGVDLAPLRRAGVRIITINDSWRLAPDADVLYFCDPGWWQRQIHLNPRAADGTSFHEAIYKGFWITVAPGFGEHPQVRQLQLTGERGLETDPTSLRHGSNSLYQCLNLACHLGAGRVVLLGADMRVVGGRSHWHDDSYIPPAEFQKVIDQSFLPHFASLVAPLRDAGVEVVNATPGSALTCWPVMSLDEALNSSIQ